MSWYNHFAQSKYDRIEWSSLKIGDKFRYEDFAGKNRRRRNIICTKTGVLSMIEDKSKVTHTFHHVNFTVYSQTPQTDKG